MGVRDIAAVLRRNEKGAPLAIRQAPVYSELVHAHGACVAWMKHSASDRLVQRNAEFPGEAIIGGELGCPGHRSVCFALSFGQIGGALANRFNHVD